MVGHWRPYSPGCFFSENLYQNLQNTSSRKYWGKWPKKDVLLTCIIAYGISKIAFTNPGFHQLNSLIFQIGERDS